MGDQYIKDVFGDDGKVWTVSARVEVLDGQTSHFEVNAEGDLIVSCVTLLHGVSIWANLDTLAGGSDGSGVWHIPDPGTEVSLQFDHGDFEGEAHIVARTSGGKAPAGLSAGKVFVLGTSVEVRSPGGVATKLPTLADFQALVDKINDLISHYLSHTHTSAAAGSPTGPPLPPDDSISNASDPTGTTVIKVE